MTTTRHPAPVTIVRSRGAHHAAQQARRRTPHLVYGGGPLLEGVQVFVLFYGSEWTADVGHRTDAAALVSDFRTLLADTQRMGILSEYSAGQYTLPGTCKVISSYTDPSPAAKVLTDGDIRAILQKNVNLAHVPGPMLNSVTFVFVQPGTAVSAFGSASCTGFCGYHDLFTLSSGKTMYYAVMPYDSCVGCNGTSLGLTPKQTLFATASHELTEAQTDPDPGTGWVDPNTGEEIGDICAWEFITLPSGLVVQKEFSNVARGCI